MNPNTFVASSQGKENFSNSVSTVFTANQSLSSAPVNEFRHSRSAKWTAIDGATVEIESSKKLLFGAVSSHIDVSFDGVTHQIRQAQDRRAFDFSNTTGTFHLNSGAGTFKGFVSETIDTVATQAVIRHSVMAESAHSVVIAHSYDGYERALELLGALNLFELNNTLAASPDGRCEFAGPARVVANIALPTANSAPLTLGVLEVSPLDEIVLNELPDWQGTPVEGGELFSGRSSSGSPYLQLVSNTARATLLLSNESVADQGAATLAGLSVSWTR